MCKKPTKDTEVNRPQHLFGFRSFITGTGAEAKAEALLLSIMSTVGLVNNAYGKDKNPEISDATDAILTLCFELMDTINYRLVNK